MYDVNNLIRALRTLEIDCSIESADPYVITLEEITSAVGHENVQSVIDQIAEVETKAYIIQRQSEYPSFGEQLDYIYHHGVEAWKSDIVDPIKAKYPKTGNNI